MLGGQQIIQEYPRLMAETQGRDVAQPVVWSARGELRNPRHLQPEVWLHLKAQAVLPLTCQRCLGVVDVALMVERSFRFVDDESAAAVQDEQSEEDVLALSREFDLPALVEDELLMALPLAARHEICPQPVKLAGADAQFDRSASRQDNPFSILGKLKSRKS